MLSNELDLQREGASASLLRRNFASGVDLYVPEVHWDFSTERVLTLERVHGVSADDVAAIDKAGLDRKRLAAKGVRLFYEQVFRDNFFHADAHPGNIWVDTSRVDEPRFIALDFGIMGSLPEADQYWLAENFIALFERDYARIAQLHVAAGWMPATVRIDELEAAVRTVCEPYFTRPLAQISIAELVVKLFQTARRFELTLQPQLILLQKTLLNIEGVGRMLDPEIDIWAVAHPVLRRILRERYSVRATLRDVRRRLPEWIHSAPRMPELVRDALRQVASGQRQEVADPLALAVVRDDARRMRRLVACSLLGAALLVSAALVGTLAPRGMWPAVVAGLVGLASFAAGWPRRTLTTVLEILYQDDDIVAVNKPANLAVHRSKFVGPDDAFLIDLLREQVEGRLHLAHRLDRATSGVLLVARSPEVAGQLGEQFMGRSVRKRYLAVVRGWPEPEEGTVDYPPWFARYRPTA